MALTYDVSQVRDMEEVLRDGDWDATQRIIFETVAVGIGKLTEVTLPEFKVRSDLWRTLEGFDLIPLAELRRRVGLRTNVFPDDTWFKFMKRQLNFWRHTHKEAIVYALEELDGEEESRGESAT